MTEPRRRGLNDAVTQMWSFLAPVYDLPVLQRWVYRPPHDEVIAQLRATDPARSLISPVAQGFSAIESSAKSHPDEIYGVDMSDGMLAQARARPTG